MLIKISALVFVASCLCFSVNAIKCYNCNTAGHGACEKPTADTVVECAHETFSLDQQSLSEITMQSKADAFACYNHTISRSGKSVITRGCTKADTVDVYCKGYEAWAEQTGGKLISCKICTKDLCNSSNGLHAQLLTSIYCVFVVLFALCRFM